MKNFKLTVENVVGNLFDADGGSFVSVKETAIKFIVEHLDEVVDSKTYKNLH